MTTWKLHIEMTEAKAFRKFIRNYFFKSKWVSINIKLTLRKALIKSVMTYSCPAWELMAHTYNLKLQHLQNEVPYHWKFSKVHTGLQFSVFNLPYV
jgi:hypothetical protein